MKCDYIRPHLGSCARIFAVACLLLLKKASKVQDMFYCLNWLPWLWDESVDRGSVGLLCSHHIVRAAYCL